MKSYSIRTDSIVISDAIEESGFIALREEGQLISAVTATTMEKFSFQSELHGAQLKNCRFVVVDCNLSSSSLNLIQTAAADAGKKIFVSGVSETKAKRLLEMDRRDSMPFPFFVIAINNFEAAALELPVSKDMDLATVIDCCKRLGGENIIVTLGEDGHCVLKYTGDAEWFPAPTVSQIVSLTGCGDALLAAVCHYYYQNRDLVWPDCQRVISRFVNQVISRRGATIGARTAPKELRVVPKDVLYNERQEHKEKVISVVGSRTVSLFGARVPLSEVFAFVAFLVAIGATTIPLLAKFYSP